MLTIMIPVKADKYSKNLQKIQIRTLNIILTIFFELKNLTIFIAFTNFLAHKNAMIYYIKLAYVYTLFHDL